MRGFSVGAITGETIGDATIGGVAARSTTVGASSVMACAETGAETGAETRGGDAIETTGDAKDASAGDTITSDTVAGEAVFAGEATGSGEATGEATGSATGSGEATAGEATAGEATAGEATAGEATDDSIYISKRK